MMRVLLLSIGVVLATALTASFAQAENPWIRTCRVDQGQFWVLKAGTDDYSMCFFGDAGIGAESFFLFKTKSTTNSEALRTYKNRKTSSPRGGVCGAFDADLIEAKDSEGQTFNICRFSDLSLIEETTLWLGPGSVGNENLDRALSKTY